MRRDRIREEESKEELINLTGAVLEKLKLDETNFSDGQNIYTIQYDSSNKTFLYPDAFRKRKTAERIASQMRASGKKKVNIDNLNLVNDDVYEALEDSDKINFFTLRDDFTNDELVDKFGDFTNIYEHDDTVSAVPKDLLKNKYAVSVEQNVEDKTKRSLKSREELEKYLNEFKEVDPEALLMFFVSSDKYGQEYSILTKDKGKAMEVAKKERQYAIGSFDENGSYNEVPINESFDAVQEHLFDKIKKNNYNYFEMINESYKNNLKLIVYEDNSYTKVSKIINESYVSPSGDID